MCLSPVFVRKQWCYVPCGKCIECAIEKSNEWAFRVALENRLHKRSCMITLTYNEDNLATPSLERRDVQLFLKRLREKIEPVKVRYFGCGDYGSLKGRKHFHIIVFGYDFDDKYYFCTDNKGTRLYRSPTLEKLWSFGFSAVGEVTFDTAKYCAIYMQKKHFEDGRKPPFVFMSLRPGIGADSVTTDWLLTDRIYVQGKYIKIPRYFLSVLEKRYNIDLTWLKEQRRERGKVFDNLSPVDKESFLLLRKNKWKRLLKKIDKRGKIV